MTTNYQVVLYGASGYTGKLTAWKLAKRGIPFIAAGRDAARLAAEMEKIPELKGHDYKCVSVKHDTASLTELLKGKKVVLNIVGPFMQLGLPVVQAALAAGCHYFDTTGETDWIMRLKKEFGAASQRRSSHCARPTPICGPRVRWQQRLRWKPRASTRWTCCTTATLR